MDDEKQIRWLGSAYDDLLAFPKDARKEVGFQLGKVQVGLDPASWKPFDEVGPGTQGDSDQRGKRNLPRDVRRQVRGSHLRPALLPEEDSSDQQAGQGYHSSTLSRRRQHE